ncbi:hypothetical protein ACE6H2_015731 [Prunus campanulata]
MHSTNPINSNTCTLEAAATTTSLAEGKFSLSSSDVGVLVAQIKDLERKNAKLEEQNKNLTSME